MTITLTLKNYIGRGDLTAFYRWNDNDFSLMLRHSLKGGDDSHGAMQFDWAFPIKGKLRGHFQLFDGYGESLIDYKYQLKSKHVFITKTL